MAAGPKKTPALSSVPTRGQNIILAVISSGFGVSACIVAYLLYYLYRNCDFAPPYTLEACITDNITRNFPKLLLYLVYAQLVLFLPNWYYFYSAAKEWRSGSRFMGRMFGMGAGSLGSFGILVWYFWSFGPLVRYWSGTDLKEIFGSHQPPVDLFNRAFIDMLQEIWLYWVAGLVVACIYVPCLIFVDKGSRGGTVL